jgi:O-antigen/teichoic acid export membrane protein
MRKRLDGTTGVVAAASLARLAILFVLVVAAHRLTSNAFDTIVYVLAVSTAFQVLVDPGTSTLLVVKWPAADLRRRGTLVRGGLAVQVAAALCVFAATSVAGWLSSPDSSLRFAAAALGALAAAESIERFVRSPMQAQQRYRQYALVDVLIALGRVVTALALAVFGSVAVFAGANLVAMAFALVIAVVIVAPYLRERQPLRVRALLGATWPYGGSTVFSSLYSQAPTVLLGVFGGLRAAAVYSVAARLTQPTELIPAGIAATHLPRLISEPGDRSHVFASQARIALAAGVAVAVLLSAGAPIALPILGVQGHAWVLVILALVLPIKFLNYQLVALAAAVGKIKTRMVMSAAVACICVGGVILLASHGPEAVALLVLCCEGLLAALLTLAAPRQGAAIYRPTLEQ